MILFRPSTSIVTLMYDFGPPNGFAMTLREDSSDNLIQYHYTLQAGERMIDIYGKNTQVEFILESPVPLTSEDLKHLISSIRDDLQYFYQAGGDAPP